MPVIPLRLKDRVHYSFALSCRTFHLPGLKESAAGTSTVLCWLQSVEASVTATPGKVGGREGGVSGNVSPVASQQRLHI